MNQRQEDHLSRVTTLTTANLAAKYRKGAEEHNGDLLDMPLLDLCDETINECTDQNIYLISMRDKIQQLENLVKTLYEENITLKQQLEKQK